MEEFIKPCLLYIKPSKIRQDQVTRVTKSQVFAITTNFWFCEISIIFTLFTIFTIFSGLPVVLLLAVYIITTSLLIQLLYYIHTTTFNEYSSNNNVNCILGTIFSITNSSTRFSQFLVDCM